MHFEMRRDNRYENATEKVLAKKTEKMLADWPNPQIS